MAPSGSFGIESAASCPYALPRCSAASHPVLENRDPQLGPHDPHRIKGEKFVRRLAGKDEIFNSVCYEFLNKQRGKTIFEIGEMDATFLG